MNVSNSPFLKMHWSLTPPPLGPRVLTFRRNDHCGTHQDQNLFSTDDLLDDISTPNVPVHPFCGRSSFLINAIGPLQKGRSVVYIPIPAEGAVKIVDELYQIHSRRFAES